MKVLHIIGTPGLGGVQTYLLDLSKYDKQYGISRNLLFLHGNEGELKEKFLMNGVGCFSCSIMPVDHGLRPYRFWKKVRKLLRIFFIIKLYRAIRFFRPNIIVCEEPSYLNMQLFVSRIQRIPFIWHIHNEYQFANVNRTIFNWLFEYYFKNNLSIISDSKYILKKNLVAFKSKMNDQWHRIPILPSTSELTNMVVRDNDKKLFPRDYIQLGSIGRLSWQKDYELLIRVFADVRKKIDVEIRLAIAGVGPMKNTLTALIQKLGLGDYVKLLGNVERKSIPKFLSSLDIYVQSSVSEGSPLTIKEAMAAALPIVSTNVGGIPEIIIDGKTGILVPKENKSKFINALIKVIRLDPVARKSIGENANNYAMKNFSMESIAKNNLAIYRKLYYINSIIALKNI